MRLGPSSHRTGALVRRGRDTRGCHSVPPSPSLSLSFSLQFRIGKPRHRPVWGLLQGCSDLSDTREALPSPPSGVLGPAPPSEAHAVCGAAERRQRSLTAPAPLQCLLGGRPWGQEASFFLPLGPTPSGSFSPPWESIWASGCMSVCLASRTASCPGLCGWTTLAAVLDGPGARGGWGAPGAGAFAVLSAHRTWKFINRV